MADQPLEPDPSATNPSVILVPGAPGHFVVRSADVYRDAVTNFDQPMIVAPEAPMWRAIRNYDMRLDQMYDHRHPANSDVIVERRLTTANVDSILKFPDSNGDDVGDPMPNNLGDLVLYIDLAVYYDDAEGELGGFAAYFKLYAKPVDLSQGIPDCDPPFSINFETFPRGPFWSGEKLEIGNTDPGPDTFRPQIMYYENFGIWNWSWSQHDAVSVYVFESDGAGGEDPVAHFLVRKDETIAAPLAISDIRGDVVELLETDDGRFKRVVIDSSGTSGGFPRVLGLPTPNACWGQLIPDCVPDCEQNVDFVFRTRPLTALPPNQPQIDDVHVVGPNRLKADDIDFACGPLGPGKKIGSFDWKPIADFGGSTTLRFIDNVHYTPGFDCCADNPVGCVGSPFQWWESSDDVEFEIRTNHGPASFDAEMFLGGCGGKDSVFFRSSEAHLPDQVTVQTQDLRVFAGQPGEASITRTQGLSGYGFTELLSYVTDGDFPECDGDNDFGFSIDGTMSPTYFGVSVPTYSAGGQSHIDIRLNLLEWPSCLPVVTVTVPLDTSGAPNGGFAHASVDVEVPYPNEQYMVINELIRYYPDNDDDMSWHLYFEPIGDSVNFQLAASNANTPGGTAQSHVRSAAHIVQFPIVLGQPMAIIEIDSPLVECDQPLGATVHLDGSASRANQVTGISEDSIVGYEWRRSGCQPLCGGGEDCVAGELIGTGPEVDVILPLGMHTVELMIVDECGFQDTTALELAVAGQAEGLMGCSPDCNGNGTFDQCDIDQGASMDENLNGTPDECEDLDCNENGTDDSEDIQSGTSSDCNSDSIPDECQIRAGSPAPGGPYFCELNCLSDCDGNGVIDVCDFSVCGDGIIAVGEFCDDGGTSGGDGCSSGCTVEGGFTCWGEPSTCLSTSLTAGLEGYWKFFADGRDSGSFGRDLNLNGAGITASGKFGPGLDLPGSGVSPTRPGDDPALHLRTSPFTIQVWVYFNNTNGEQVLLEKFDGNGWTLTKLPGGELRFDAGGIGVTSGEGVPCCPQIPPTPGVWHQVVVRRVGSGPGVDNMELYLDRQLNAIRPSFPAGEDIPPTGQPLRVGLRFNNPNFRLNGRIDDIAIWTRALSNQELDELWNNGPGHQIPVCDNSPDCNLNGVNDTCDVNPSDPDGNQQVSADGDGNNRPDECLLLDCNHNGVEDVLDVAGASSTDCNGDGIPDECQIPSGSPGSGGPFFCDPDCDEMCLSDCNQNGTLDVCDINVGQSSDCNNDSIPDECQIRFDNPGPDGPYFCKRNCLSDCDTNGVLDICEDATCGDGEVSPVESCDDGGTAGGDGCSSGCTVEGGFTCSGEPSTCVSTSLISSLEGYWKFFTDGRDSGIFGRDLNLNGAGITASGKFGPGLDLPGSGVSPTRPGDDPALHLRTSPFTIQVWVYFNNTNGEQVLLEKFDGNGWTLTKLPGGELRFDAGGIGVTSGEGVPCCPQIPPTPGVWHQVVVRRVGSGPGVDNMELYLDRQLNAIRPSFPAGEDIPPTGQPLRVGLRFNNPNFRLNGRVDDIAIWTRALSNQELDELWNNGPGHQIPVCDNSPDCNLNGVNDTCDENPSDPDGNQQVSEDVNADSVPDECQLQDCNQNGQEDLVDIGIGSSSDCNANGVPDRCEIPETSTAPGGSFYCSVACLVECGNDCNENGVPDECDIASGNSLDSNADGVPDECFSDCNSNGVPDSDDIDPADPDGNGLVSSDSDANGVPDECQLRFVDGSAPLGGNGRSWATAYNDLPSALGDALQAGGGVDDIWVAAGTYKPDQGGGQTPGDRTATFQLINGVALYGGFAGTEDPGTFDLSTRDFVANETILSGDLLNDDNSGGDSSENSFNVVTASNTEATAVLDGFTVTAGNGSGGGVCGSGLYISGGSPMVNNCTFSQNTCSSGGGMQITNSSPTLIDCTFVGNVADFDGGAMVNINSTPTMIRCYFSGNVANGPGAAGRGGAIYNGGGGGSSPAMTDCTFIGNAGARGGAMWTSGANSNPTLTDCTFVDNSASVNGGAIASENNSGLTLTRCIFIGNTASGPVLQGGGAISLLTSTAMVTNSVFLANASINGDGGAIQLENTSNLELINCALSGNRSGQHGGAINLTGAGSPASSGAVTNCTFTENIAGNTAGGAMHVGAGSIAIDNTILWLNQPQQIWLSLAPPDMGALVNHSATDGGLGATAGCTSCAIDLGGNINADPLFVGGPGGTWTTDADYCAPDDPDLDSSNPPQCTAGPQAGLTVGQTRLIDSSADFGPIDSLAARFLNPDTNQPLQSLIVSNTATEIVVWGDFSAEGVTGATYQVKDFRLTGPSPCVDAADNVGVPVGIISDLDGALRFLDDPYAPDCPQAPDQCGTPPIVDMGAYEAIPAIPGDFDRDGDVDQQDLAAFENCRSGPTISLASGCEDKNFDSDNDIDQNDFGLFQRCISGENNPADPTCAD